MYLPILLKQPNNVAEAPSHLYDQELTKSDHVTCDQLVLYFQKSGAQ